jgi:hypothetical protein
MGAKPLYCAEFIDSECGYGPIGTFVDGLFDTGYVTRSGTPGRMGHFIAEPPTDIADFCPNYHLLDFGTKRKFWVWTLMQMAFDEGGCGDPVVVKAVHDYSGGGKFDGTLALPAEDTVRSQVRPNVCTDAVLGKGAVGETRATLRCGLSMLAVQLAVPGSANSETKKGLAVFSSGTLAYSQSYWEKLRHPHEDGPKGRVGRRIKAFAACGNPEPELSRLYAPK